MSGLDSIVGQVAARRELDRMLAHARVPHALLFHGPECVGKATTARAFARALLCSAGTSACGECADCRLVDKGNHPDLLWVQRLPKKDTPASRSAKPSTADLASFIVVDQIRELTHYAGLTPRQARHRVFVIDEAERMNPAAQNALLKTLEEPVPSTVLVLVSSRPFLLLSTVRSRCLAVPFAPLAPAELVELLERRDVDRDEARLRTALAGGRAGDALTLDVDALSRRREDVLSSVERLLAGPAALAELPGRAAAMAGSDERTTTEHLDLLQSLLRDAARAALGREDALLHADLAPRLAALGRRMGPLRAAELVSSIDRLRGELRFNLNRLLIVESLLAALAGAPRP